ncbi:MAG: hypothetical protein GX111_11010 [Clostridiales bacterium]|jgi:hypothetical protein|nr:hypothetical protein [Clostridiales bacterium]
MGYVIGESRDQVMMLALYEMVAVDGTRIKASNNKKMSFSRKKLDARLKHIDKQIKNT